MRRFVLAFVGLTLVTLLALQFARLSPATRAQSYADKGPGSRTQMGGRHQTLDPAGIERLKNDTGGRAKVTVSGATGGARFVSFAPGTKGDLMQSRRGASARDKSAAFLEEYGSVFGLRDARSELKLKAEKNDRQGGRHLTYEQLYRGVPVFAGVLKAHFDGGNELTAVNGNIIPEIDLDPRPSRSAQEAGAEALAAVREEYSSSAPLNVGTTKLYIYRTGLVQGVDGNNYLAWEVEVGNGADVRELVYVDAHSGKVVDRLPGIIDGMTRRAYDGQNLNGIPPSYPGSPYWIEGQAFPTASTEANNLLTTSKETYDFYFNAFGRDSFDGAGKIMDSIFNRGYSCPNASWNGTFISFCPGMTSDDMTGHEWTHAYTEYTHNLIYAWQPGALNEAYSDIFGEAIDLINDRGTDAPGGNRDANGANCSEFTPFPPSLKVNSPASIAGVYGAGRANFGPSLTNTGVTGDVVQANDGSTDVILGPAPLATTSDGCQPFTTPAGKIAYVDRGNCGFKLKVKNAQDGGAAGVIIANVVSTQTLTNMADDPTITTPITIPSINIAFATNNVVRPQLASGVNASLRLNAPPPPLDNSYRWLVGEDDTAVGLTGALRDMWQPVCQGNPGKVSDAEYGCSTADNGGVHDNSGVPNHAFALIVDGGTYNGQTILGIGLTKAAHIYYRAMTVYQHSASDFPDHADAIEQSATDLIGVNLADLTTGAPSGQVITTADVGEVEKTMLAVEMRMPPTQCNFQPLLGQTPPADPSCTVTRTLFAADFEGDTSSWMANYDTASGSFTPRNWSVSSTLPDNRAGSAFFGPNPNIGLCTASSDETGVLHLTSPEIQLPAAISSGPTLTFEHWVATEPGYDGGQLMISVNGGAFTLVPQANFIYNAHNRTLFTAAQGNSNPRAGQSAWSGIDGGSVDGSWAKSIVDLAGLAAAGDKIQLRWDISTDCGGGRFGWYIDDVNVYACEPDADGDGVRDGDDDCSGTTAQATVVIGTGQYSQTGVPNHLFPTGCTLQQLIDACAAAHPKNRGGFVDCVSSLTSEWVADGVITSAQKDAIMRAAGQARR